MVPKIAAKWEMIDKIFIRKNFPVMTWKELLAAVNAIRPVSERVSMGALRHQARRMGLYKQIYIHWSSEDIDFLLNNYQKIGNVEMAAILNKKHNSYRVINGEKTYRSFTKKHIEKKMKLLKLHRTKEQILKIKKRNLTTTNFRVITSDDNLWTRGLRKKYDEQSIRIRKGKRFIKINGIFTPYTRWFYHNFVQPVPDGYIVCHLDCDVLNDDIDNLICVKRTGMNLFSRYTNALCLLKKREEKILNSLPQMNYDKQRDAIRRMHSDLNRIRGLSRKVSQKLENHGIPQAQPVA